MLMIQPPPRASGGQRRVTAVEDAAQVRVDDAVPLFDGHVGNGTKHADAGVVDQDVETAELRDGLRERRLRPRCDLTNVGANAQHVLAERPNAESMWPDPVPWIATDAPLDASARAVPIRSLREPPVRMPTFL